MQSTFYDPQDEMSDLFHRLPDGVVDLILHHVDPNTFASLAVLNHKWRDAADTCALYRYHLAQCPNIPGDDDSTDAAEVDDISQLRRTFAQQVRRNLFAAYLTPRRRIIKLTAPSTSSSLAFPYGEVFKISFSPKGRWMLATSSSRIFVIHLSGLTPVLWRELEVSRRPVAVELADSGDFLAVLSPNQRVTTYRLDNHAVRCIQSIMLESPSSTIALSSDCSVLAAAHDQYIEIISLSQTGEQLPVTKRTVACNQIDRLAFYLDDTFLCGTSTKRRKPTTIVIPKPRAPVDEDGSAVESDPGRLWTTEVLFPNTFQTCSHAIGLPSKLRLSPRVFAFDVPADVFGVLDLEEMAYGPTTFALPSERSSSAHLSTVMPSVTTDGIQVAFLSTKTGVWLYSDPNGSNIVITKAAQDHGTVQGHKVSTGSKLSGLQWVASKLNDSVHRQLVGVLPGGALEQDPDADQIREPQDTAQVMLLDFDYYVSSGSGDVEEITLELNTGEIEKLEDDHIQLDTLIPAPRQELSASLSRQMRRQSVPLGRSITSATRNTQRRREQPSAGNPGARNTIAYGVSSALSLSSVQSLPRSATTASSGSRGRGEDADAFDDPYSHQQPRSRTTLQRAATASAGVRRQHLASLPTTPLQFRRADGRGELPHESDADNWVPPPPPYAAKSDTPLPHFLRQISLPLALAPPQQQMQRRWSHSNGTGPPLMRARSFDDDLSTGALDRTSSSLYRAGTVVVAGRPPLLTAASFPSPDLDRDADGSSSPPPLPSPSPPVIPFNDESERPMSSNLADGFYTEPFDVWAADIDDDQEGTTIPSDAAAAATATPPTTTINSAQTATPQTRLAPASIAATLARASSTTRPEVVSHPTTASFNAPEPHPPPDGLELDPDPQPHRPTIDGVSPAALAAALAAVPADANGLAVGPAGLRVLGGVRDYYGPGSDAYHPAAQQAQAPLQLPQHGPHGLYTQQFAPYTQQFAQQPYAQPLDAQYGQRSAQPYPYPFQNRAVVVQGQSQGGVGGGGGGYAKERAGMGGEKRERGWRKVFKCVVM